MSKAALVVARSLGAACAMLALAPALAQSWEDNQQGEYPAQSAADEEAYPDDEATTGAEEGNYDSEDQIDGDQNDDPQVYDHATVDESRSEQGNEGLRRGYELTGSGVGDLYPALRDTPQGRRFVLRRYDINRDQRISRYEAREANRAFFQLADRNRDGRLTGSEVRFTLDGRQWQRGVIGDNRDYRRDQGPRYDDR